MGSAQNYKMSNNLQHYTFTIHPEKCNLMILSRNKFIGPQKQVKLDNKPITTVSTCKCLGLTIDRLLLLMSLKYVNHFPKKTVGHALNVPRCPSALYSILIWGSSYLNQFNDIHIHSYLCFTVHNENQKISSKRSSSSHLQLEARHWKIQIGTSDLCQISGTKNYTSWNCPYCLWFLTDCLIYIFSPTWLDNNKM